MSTKNPKGAGGDLNIPTLGGESAQASAATSSGAALSDHQPAQPSLADIQAQADAQLRSTQAIHRPTTIRNERYQEAEVPDLTLEMPLSGSLDAMHRPDLHIEPVVDLMHFHDKAAQLSFLEEMLLIRIHETGDKNDESVVQLGINGRQVFIPRGQDCFVRRKYVELLLRAKPEAIRTDTDSRNSKGDPMNLIHKSRALKYPFSILRDDNPRGRAWERKVRSEA